MKSKTKASNPDPTRGTQCLLDRVCESARLRTILRRRCYRSESSHSVYRVTTTRGVFAVHLRREKSTPQGWIRYRRVRALRLAPRLVREGAVAAGQHVYHYSVAEWLKGRRLDYRRDLQRFAGALARLHQRTRGWQIAGLKTRNLFGFLGEQLARHSADTTTRDEIAGRLRRATDVALSSLGRTREQTSGLRCLVHNDLVRENIIIASGQVRLVDWEWAMYASPVLDLCGFLSPVVTSWDGEFALSDHAIATFLNTYLGTFSRNDARALARDLRSAWDPYNAMVAYWVRLNAPDERSHFKERGFYKRTFARSKEISQGLKVWSAQI